MSSADLKMQEGIKYFELNNFRFQDGTIVTTARLAYRVFNPLASRTALVPTCFRGRIDTTLNFTNGALKEFRVIVVALFGNGESSSPSNTPSGFAKSLDYRDCVAAQYQLVHEHLGIESLDVIIGFSMGGQCAFHWAAMYPNTVKCIVAICASARTSLHNAQFLEGPAAALENAVDYADGAYKLNGIPPMRGLNAFGCAYSAWLTSAEWFERSLFKTHGHATREAWTATICKGYDDWDPDDLLIMLRMWQNSDLGVYIPSGALEDVLGRLKAKVLVLPCQTDQYFTWQHSKRESQFIMDAQFDIIPSVWGHIAGSGANPEDTNWLHQRITKFLLNNP